jgi:hypothetical protein
VSQVIDLEEGRLLRAVKRGYRNWESRFRQKLGLKTSFSHLSPETLSYLAQGKEKGAFYLYDLIMSLMGWGSGFEFNELSSKKKMAVIDRYLFLLDRIRFECMKRLGWIDEYPGEEFAIVELITQFEKLGPGLQAKIPLLSRDHAGHEEFSGMDAFDRDVFIRKLIPKAVAEIQDYSTTL